MHINPQTAGYAQTQLEALYRTMEERFHALPGVMKVGIASYTPMEDNNWGNGVQVQGQPNLERRSLICEGECGVFRFGGNAGGDGTRDRRAGYVYRPAVAVVNQIVCKDRSSVIAIRSDSALARPGRLRRETLRSSAWWRIRPTQACAWKDHSMYFVPMMQRPGSTKEPIENDMSLYAGAIVLQTERPMNDMEKLAQGTLAGINPNLTVVKFQTFDQQIAGRFTEERMIARLTMLFGGLALLLASDWTLRRDRLYRRAADSGDWHPDGARGGARGRDRDGDAAGR